MKTFKKWALGIALVAGLATAAAAFPPGNPGGPDDRVPNFERMADMMGIAADKREAFIDIMKAEHEKRLALRKGMFEQMKAMHDETVKKLEGIVTPEQLKWLETRGPGQRDAMGPHGNRGEGMRGDRSCDGPKW